MNRRRMMMQPKGFELIYTYDYDNRVLPTELGWTWFKQGHVTINLTDKGLNMHNAASYQKQALYPTKRETAKTNNCSLSVDAMIGYWSWCGFSMILTNGIYGFRLNIGKNGAASATNCRFYIQNGTGQTNVTLTNGVFYEKFTNVTITLEDNIYTVLVDGEVIQQGTAGAHSGLEENFNKNMLLHDTSSWGDLYIESLKYKEW